MFIRCLLDYLAAFQMLLLKRNLGEFKAVFKARKDFRGWRADFISARQDIQRSRKSLRIPELVNVSLLWQYYVKRKKNFRSIVK